MDVRDIKYQDNYFDLAIDKSTIDALLCGENSFINVTKMIKEVQRTLKVGGVYMVISYGQPDNRVFHFERAHLDFEVTIYTIKKNYKVQMESHKYEKVRTYYTLITI
jgi:ubiquinone/menaquinone biosynthesis C-methylase UbiE